MKILFPYLSRWHTANRSRYHQLLTHLARRGHQVFVLVAPPIALDDISSRDIEDPGSEGITLPPGLELIEMRVSEAMQPLWQTRLPRTKLIRKAAIAVSSIGDVRRLITSQRIDLLFLYNLPQVLLTGVEDCHIHFDLADDLVAMLEGEDRSVSRWGGRRLAEMIERRILGRVDSLSVASSELSGRVAGLRPGRPPLLLPNGADLAFLDQLPEPPRQGGRGGSWRRPTAGFVGAFEYWVDIGLLLAVAERLPGWRFLLAGGGRRLPELRREVSARRLTNVELTGALPYAAAMREARRMDVCLLPFVHSAVADGSCPLKLFEYAALRRPVVSTLTTEVGRIGRGWISFADDPDSFASAIERFRKDPALTQTMTEVGRDLVESRFNWPMLAERFERFIAGDLPSPADY